MGWSGVKWNGTEQNKFTATLFGLFDNKNRKGLVPFHLVQTRRGGVLDGMGRPFETSYFNQSKEWNL